MTKTFRLALAACLASAAFMAALPTVARADDAPPQNLTYSAVWVPKTHTVAPMLGYRATTIQNLFGSKSLAPDLYILGGYDPGRGKVLGGFSLLFNRPIAKNVNAQFGPAWVTTSIDGKSHFGVCASVNIRL